MYELREPNAASPFVEIAKSSRSNTVGNLADLNLINAGQVVPEVF
jgi:hypothetical protein